MNKKLIIGICAGVLAVVIIVVAIFAITKSINPTGDGGSDKPSSSQGSEQTSADNSSDTESGNGTSSGTGSGSGSGSSSSGSSSGSSDTSSDSSSGESTVGGVVPPAVETEKGETFTVPVILKENPGMVMAHMEIVYDSDRFEYKGYEKGSIFKDYEIVDDKKGTISLVVYSEDSLFVDTDRNGTLISLKFKAKSNVEAGEYKITVSKPATEVMFVNAAEQEVTARVYGKSIIVK